MGPTRSMRCARLALLLAVSLVAPALAANGASRFATLRRRCFVLCKLPETHRELALRFACIAPRRTTLARAPGRDALVRPSPLHCCRALCAARAPFDAASGPIAHPDSSFSWRSLFQVRPFVGETQQPRDAAALGHRARLSRRKLCSGRGQGNGEELGEGGGVWRGIVGATREAGCRGMEKGVPGWGAAVGEGVRGGGGGADDHRAGRLAVLPGAVSGSRCRAAAGGFPWLPANWSGMQPLYLPSLARFGCDLFSPRVTWPWLLPSPSAGPRSRRRPVPRRGPAPGAGIRGVGASGGRGPRRGGKARRGEERPGGWLGRRARRRRLAARWTRPRRVRFPDPGGAGPFSCRALRSFVAWVWFSSEPALCAPPRDRTCRRS